VIHSFVAILSQLTYKEKEVLIPDRAVSNKCIVKDIGFLNLMQYADIVMAECDFAIRDEVEMRGDYLSHPPFRNGKFQLPSESTRSTAEVRIHIEPLCHQMVADENQLNRSIYDFD
jgi:hypothetical protein